MAGRAKSCFKDCLQHSKTRVWTRLGSSSGQIHLITHACNQCLIKTNNFMKYRKKHNILNTKIGYYDACVRDTRLMVIRSPPSPRADDPGYMVTLSIGLSASE